MDLLGFGTDTDEDRPTLLVVQPIDSWPKVDLGPDAAQLVGVHRELASQVRMSDLVFVADLTLLLTELTGDRQPWDSRQIDLDGALDQLRDLASAGRVVSHSVEMTHLGFGLACSACRDLTMHHADGKRTMHRDAHIDDVKGAVLEAWGEGAVTGGLRMRGWRP
jgi:hypothetical protein